MSSTRKAKDESVFHQSRYASSEEFERGLIANLVAKRAALLDDKPDRELIWFIQHLSHLPGGVAAVAKDIIAKFPERIQTRQMLELKLSRTKVCSADNVRRIRVEFPNEYLDRFLLKGEMIHSHRGIIIARVAGDEWKQSEDGLDPKELALANQQPEEYPASVFFDRCFMAAENLQNYISEMCLNPALDFSNGGPWYFPTLIQTLREYQQNYIQRQSAGAVTTLGKKVFEVLDYAAFSRGLVLMEGKARLGKSFAAKSWCLQNPGRARFVEVPSFSDDMGFFQALARGIGLGKFLNYKASQIRERVESVLLTGDILLVLDEAHYLWPLRDLRRGHPGRIIWAMSMANAGVPICCISTPQFLDAQKAMEKSGWNSAQLTGRIAHYESLPSELTDDDLMAVARTVLPNATETVLKALAAYARSSSRYLAAVYSISKRASYIATRAGRQTCSTDDVRQAMKESVIPSDQRLQSTLRASPVPGRGRRSAPLSLDEPVTMPERGNLIAAGARNKHEFKAPLIEA